MAKKKAAAAVAKTVTSRIRYEMCSIYSSEPMQCFLCGAMTTPNVKHTCSRIERK